MSPRPVWRLEAGVVSQERKDGRRGRFGEVMKVWPGSGRLCCQCCPPQVEYKVTGAVPDGTIVYSSTSAGP